MKKISLTQKFKVVKLFLTGLSYDQIAQQIGIAKGSVVNIIDEFRKGHLRVPPDMTEYVDALRQVAVDLRKNNASIAQVRSCLKLDLKLKEMGVSNEKAERWLDICAGISSPTVSTDQFVGAALELSQLASESGLSYGDMITDYNAKLSRSKELSKEIEREEQQLTEVRARHQEDKEQATRELDAVTNALATAQDMFHKQKNDLKAQMDEYLTQNKLSWQKINTAIALLDRELGRASLTGAEIENLSGRIYRAGSLINIIKQLGQEKERLQSEVEKLAHKEQTCATNVKQLKNIDENLRESISANKQTLGELNTELKSQRGEVEELKQTTSQYTQNLYVSRLLLDFLFAPKAISDYDIDRLVSLMIGLRQKRLGIGPKQVIDPDGKVICECQLPRMYGNTKMDEPDIDEVRGVFAHLLTPLVKDKFISRFDYDMAEIKNETSQTIAVTEAILEERKKHII
jgi:predicted  nucleic acid-binding Zn-ribbon protein